MSFINRRSEGKADDRDLRLSNAAIDGRERRSRRREFRYEIWD
jgi:hypothetical protein